MTPANASRYAAIEAHALRAGQECLVACRAYMDAAHGHRERAESEMNRAQLRRQAIESDLRMTIEIIAENEAVGRRSHLSIAGVA